MKTIKTLLVGVALTAVLAMTGCGSTLFFPARSAERAADKVIDDIWPEVTKPATGQAEEKKS